MAIYTVLIQCSILFIWEAIYCSGQTADRCFASCMNGGTCLETSCRCPDGYTGITCETKYLNYRPLRKIDFVTAKQTSNNILPYYKKYVDKGILVFKVTKGCGCNISLQDRGSRKIELIMNDRDITDIKIQNRSSLGIINVSCRRFQNVTMAISWNSENLTFGTVDLINNTLRRSIVKSYPLNRTFFQAMFSSTDKTAWISYEAAVDAEHLITTDLFGQPARLCPISQQYQKIPLDVNFLNRSVSCSEKMDVRTACDTSQTTIKYNGCTSGKGKCRGLQETLWIAACKAMDKNCSSCKITNFTLDITKTCQNTAQIGSVVNNRFLEKNNCSVASTYMIIWHEIRDVLFEDLLSSTSSSYTSTVEQSASRSSTPTYSEDVSFISTVEQSPSRSPTPTYSEKVSFISTAGNIIDDSKPQQISDNQKIIGLTVGASVSAAIIVILLICLLLVLRRRSIEQNSAKKNQTVQSSGDVNDYTGRQNIALPMQEDLSEYNELAMRRDSHQYGDLTSVGTKLNETTYDYIDHHKHKQETDNCKIDQINSIQDQGDELIHDYSVLDPNEKTSNTVKVMSNTGRDGDTYAVLDPDESTTLCSGANNSDRLDKPFCESNNAHTKESTGVHTKDEAYAVLDPNITGFDRTENVAKNQSAENYTVLDPSITGFNRSDLTHGLGDMTMDHVNKQSLIQPYKEDGTDYEFAKPIDDNLSSKSYLPSNRDRTNSGESYGTYQTGNTRPIQDINQQNSEENVYNRTVDDVYDSAAHTKMPTSRDDTYDHFSGEKV